MPHLPFAECFYSLYISHCYMKTVNLFSTPMEEYYIVLFTNYIAFYDQNDCQNSETIMHCSMLHSL